MLKTEALRERLPTTLGFSPLTDRARLPGRFFYRLIAGMGPLG